MKKHRRHGNRFAVRDRRRYFLGGLSKNRKMRLLSAGYSTIKFTSSHSLTNIPFLDVSVSLTNHRSISTDLYTKPRDKHQHLLYSSCHPLHTKKAIPFSLALRLRRICSTDATFHTRTAQLTTYLLKRGYNCNFVNKQIRRAADIPVNSLYKPKTSTNLNEYHL